MSNDPMKPTSVGTMSDGSAAVGGSFEFDGGKAYMGDASYATPQNTGMYNFIKPGQRILGTTVYNPKPEDPQQEAMYGERRYHEKPDPKSANAMRQTIDEQAQKIDRLESMMAAFLSAQGGGKTEAKAEPEPVVADEAPQAAANIATRTPTKTRRQR